MNTVTHYKTVQAYTTKDGSLIRELMHPEQHGNQNQSLAEATLLAGQTSSLHKHKSTEELYHITQGTGLMTLNNDTFQVNVGDTVLIPPDTPHKIKNIGSDELKILCCCSPAYSHQDTFLLEK